MITLEGKIQAHSIFEKVTLQAITTNTFVEFQGTRYYATQDIVMEFPMNISSYEIVSSYNPKDEIKIEGNKIVWRGFATTPNNPLQIILKIILFNGTLVINRTNMLSFDIPHMDRGEIDNASFGIYSNGGKISFSDYRGIVPLLNPQTHFNVKVWLVNTLTKGKTLVCDMLTKEWDYDNDSKAASVSIYDGLEDWQNINFSGIPYNFNEPSSKTCQYFYEELQKFSVGLGYKVISFEELDENTRQILTSTVISYPFLNSSKLWKAWEKLCIACQLHIFKKFDGTISCKYGKGM